MMRFFFPPQSLRGRTRRQPRRLTLRLAKAWGSRILRRTPELQHQIETLRPGIQFLYTVLAKLVGTLPHECMPHSSSLSVFQKTALALSPARDAQRLMFTPQDLPSKPLLTELSSAKPSVHSVHIPNSAIKLIPGPLRQKPLHAPGASGSLL